MQANETYQDSEFPEAMKWLHDNQNDSALATNMFGDTETAERFVWNLYLAGAAYVGVICTYDEPERIKREGGPYADTLVVRHKEPTIPFELLKVIGETGADDIQRFGDYIRLWWD